LNHNFCPGGLLLFGVPAFKLAVVSPKGSKLKSVAHSYGCTYAGYDRKSGKMGGFCPNHRWNTERAWAGSGFGGRGSIPQAANSQAAGSKAGGCAGALPAKCPCDPVLWPEIGAGQIQVRCGMKKENASRAE